MKFFGLLVFCILFHETFSLTVQGLFRKLKERRSFNFPDDESLQKSAFMPQTDSTRSPPPRSFIRPVGSVAGKAILPRRWTSGQQVKEVSIDENGIAIPVRKHPKIGRILKPRGGLRLN